jgi:hypothetical protein
MLNSSSSSKRKKLIILSIDLRDFFENISHELIDINIENTGYMIAL